MIKSLVNDLPRMLPGTKGRFTVLCFSELIRSYSITSGECSHGSSELGVSGIARIKVLGCKPKPEGLE